MPQTTWQDLLKTRYNYPGALLCLPSARSAASCPTDGNHRSNNGETLTWCKRAGTTTNSTDTSFGPLWWELPMIRFGEKRRGGSRKVSKSPLHQLSGRESFASSNKNPGVSKRGDVRAVGRGQGRPSRAAARPNHPRLWLTLARLRNSNLATHGILSKHLPEKPNVKQYHGQEHQDK